MVGTSRELAGIRESGLGAFSPTDVEAQVDPYPAGPRLRRMVSAHAEGNPFYVEKLVRAFREQGQLALEHGSYEVAALDLATARVVPASEVESAGLQIKLAGLHFIVGER